MVAPRGDGRTPLDIWSALREADPQFWAQFWEPRKEAVVFPNPVPLNELRRHPAGTDPNELIKDRFLCRGGSCMLVGPTGVGKSSFTMQLAIQFAQGLEFFGLRPAGELKTLIVQAENDDGDMAEMRDGVIAGLGIPPEQAERVLPSVMVLTEASRTREQFATLLQAVCAETKFDLVIVDPLLAYLGGDASSQRDVSPFLRNMLNPVLQEHGLGLILVHHTAKPMRSKDKADWLAGDFAYLGAGSAEFGNWARGVLCLESLGDNSVFKLRAGKRGKRLRWVDQHQCYTDEQYIAHHREPGVICWRSPTPTELESVGVVAADPVQEVVDAIHAGNLTKADVSRELEKDFDIKKSTAHRWIDRAVAAHAVRNGKKLTLTGKVKPRDPAETTEDE